MSILRIGELRSGMRGQLASVWGLAGVSLLLLIAIFRLSRRALGLMSHELLWYHWTVLLVAIVLMAYAEGYRGFQQRFSPRAAARARYLKEHASLQEAFLAPFFVMGYFRATKRLQITSITLTVGIVVLVLMVSQLPGPWREIVDASVVVGLTWGVISLLLFSARAFLGKDFPHPPEIPPGGIPR